MTRIVIGIDGTGLDGGDRSNVVEVVERAGWAGAKTVYRRGVGSRRRDRIRGGVGARGVNRQIRRTWQDLCRIWHERDSIWIVGYSRGGAAAISLANLILAVGVTPRGDRSDVAHEAMEAYGARPGTAGRARIAFRARHECARPAIRFLGVFDPVGALGVLPGRLSRLRFGQHDLGVRRRVRDYVALLAQDERRRAFWPVLQDAPASRMTRQIWLPGVHGDIGGPTREHPRAGVALGVMLQAMQLPLQDVTVLEAMTQPLSDSIQGVYRLARKERRPWREWMARLPGSRELRMGDWNGRRRG